ncbi:hypothetical protein H2198_002353 [Neophaeococcomyces mojaviensis]|uniref:Uncharacterized protein n=1 Tax=Neophaeococcomyces mojaviensis TaxID=3383035 RepID=A0ACC3AEK4_9EURO|nr:hypothetical protein H2198_002353 [Knufia sp. JES_112]
MLDPRILRALNAQRQQAESRKTFYETVTKVMLHDKEWLKRKRIVVCCDGTSSDDIQPSNRTNVALIHHALKDLSDDGVEQKTYYIPGCGTGHNWWLNLNNARTGNDMPNKILEAYLKISSVYESTYDQIFLVGFSRGAHIAKCVARFIHDFGILRKAPDTTAKQYSESVERYFNLWLASLTKLANDDVELSVEVDPKDEELLIRNARIRACALFDTVDTMLKVVPFSTSSMLFTPNKVLNAIDSRVCKNIDHAIQALALNEHRDLFRHVSWYRDDFEKQAAGRQLRQCWFYGYHLHVGGGGDQDYISVIPLIWMVAQLHELGLAFDFVKLTKNVESAKPLPDHRERPMLRSFSSVGSVISFAGQRVMAMSTKLSNSANDWKYLFWSNAKRTPCRRFQRNADTGAFDELPNNDNLANESIHWTVRYFDKKKVLPSPPFPNGSTFFKDESGSWAWRIPGRVPTDSSSDADTVPEAPCHDSEIMLLHQWYDELYRKIKKELADGKQPDKQVSLVRHVLHALRPVVKDLHGETCTTRTIARAVVDGTKKRVAHKKRRGKEGTKDR